MDSRLLRAFVTLADLGHFGRAADRLHITQPALTKRIRALEQSLGGKLFERDQRGAKLTSLGSLLLPDAVRIATDTDALIVRARGIAEGRVGRLDIGFGLSAIESAPALIAAFRRTYPDVTITLNDHSSAEQLRRVDAGDLDIGFLRLPKTTALAMRHLSEDRLAIVAPAGWPAVDLNALDQLNRVGFVLLTRERGEGLAAQIARWSEAVGFVPRIIQWSDDIQTVLALVSAGVAYAILPSSSARLMQDRTQMLALSGEAAAWQVGAVWNPERVSGALRNFLKIIDQPPAV